MRYKFKVTRSPMKILIVYATNSGSHYVAGEIIKDVLKIKHEVTFKKAADVDAADFAKHNLIVMGCSTWKVEGQEGMPQETMLELIKKLGSQKFNRKKFAIYGCGDSGFISFCGAVDYLEKFVENAGAKLVIKSLKLDDFFFKLEENSKLVGEWTKDLLKKI